MRLRAVATGILRLLPLAVAVPIAAIAVAQLMRAAPVRRLDRSVPSPADPAFPATVHATVGVPLSPGSRVEILRDGNELFPRMWEEIARADRSIEVHNFYWRSGRLLRSLGEALANRARAGVRVRVLYDRIGAIGHSPSVFAELRSAGAEVIALRPPTLRGWHAVHMRSHARYVLLDDHIAYTGGFGFGDQWSGSGRRTHEWRDTAVRVEGPPLAILAAGFRSLWAEASGELITTPVQAEPISDGRATVEAFAIHSSPSPASMPAERLLALSFAAAKRRLFLSVAYFAPNPFFRQLLAEAARRRVDVRVLTANRRSDLPAVWRAGRARYEGLLRAGVRLFEYQPAMMHAKTLVIDGEWSVVGAINVDSQSLRTLDESAVAVLDGSFARSMELMFFEDLEHAREIRLPSFRRRPLRERAAEQAAAAVDRLL